MRKKRQSILIHIGKCGGTSVGKHFKSTIHISQPKYNPEQTYSILIRNPIDRFISAFNWRYYLVIDCGRDKKRFKGEYELLSEIGNVNNLCENIEKYDLYGNDYIHHIYESIDYYLSPIIDNLSEDNVDVVLTTKYLDTDFYDAFGFHLGRHEKNNGTRYDKNISELGRQKVADFLVEDYDIIERLNNLGLLKDYQYEYLKLK